MQNRTQQWDRYRVHVFLVCKMGLSLGLRLGLAFHHCTDKGRIFTDKGLTHLRKVHSVEMTYAHLMRRVSELDDLLNLIFNSTLHPKSIGFETLQRR